MTNDKITVDITVTDLHNTRLSMVATSAHTAKPLEETLTLKYIASLTAEELQQSFAANVRKINTSSEIMALYLEQGAVVGLGELHAAWNAQQQNPDLWLQLLQHAIDNGLSFTEREAGVYDAVDPEFIATVSAAIRPSISRVTRSAP